MGESQSSAPESYLGKTLGRQLLVDRLIGSGGFAWVYHATGPRGEEVAVKILHSTKSTATLRFDREIKVLRSLPASPHVTAYFEHGWTDDGRPFVVMEYVDGITLKQGMAHAPRLMPSMTVEFVLLVCRAFSGLHALGVAHRDVKPANILLPSAGGIKLIDFGLIRDAQGLLKFLERDDPLGRQVFRFEIDQWLLVGTPEYMAPEQFSDALSKSGGVEQTDTWSDVFSLGVILYQLIAGRPPFPLRRGASKITRDEFIAYARWRSKLHDADLPPISSIDGALEAILRRALRVDPRQRQRDARVLEAELARYLQSGALPPIDDSLTVPGHSQSGDYSQEATGQLPVIRRASTFSGLLRESSERGSSPPGRSRLPLSASWEDDVTTRELTLLHPDDSESMTSVDPVLAEVEQVADFLLGNDDSTSREDATVRTVTPLLSPALIVEDVPTVVERPIAALGSDEFEVSDELEASGEEEEASEDYEIIDEMSEKTIIDGRRHVPEGSEGG